MAAPMKKREIQQKLRDNDENEEYEIMNEVRDSYRWDTLYNRAVNLIWRTCDRTLLL